VRAPIESALPALQSEQDKVVEELREADKFLLTTHENPDGDALGSLLAMHWILEQLGKDSLMYMSPDEFPLPWEYRNWTFDARLVGAPPDDVGERTIVFLDCGNIDRMPVDFLQADGLHILNIDHHHDNTRFGTVNHVCPVASCTAEIIWRLAKELGGVEITPPIADALYTGLVTDTGRFMYENTTADAHRMAADLIEAGVEPHRVYRRLYEDLPLRRLQLLQRALASVDRYDGGAITVAHLIKSDYEETGALETDSEGVVDHMRAVEGTAVAVLVRELLSEGREGTRKVSLRATDGRVDVSRVAREFGGGGHPQAAGFSTTMPYQELVDKLRELVGRQLAPTA
jgi:phosphoesterase RecJ-like protein